MALFYDGAVLGLSVHRAGFTKHEPVDVRPRAFHSLTLRLSGAVRLTVDGKELLSRAPCVTYMPQGKAYNTEVLESGELIAIHFTMTDGSCGEPFVYRPDNFKHFESRFLALQAATRPGHPRDYNALSLFYGLLARLESETADASGIPPKILEARNLLEKGYSDPQLSIAAVAARLGISAVYLRREFKACFGLTPVAFLQSLRIGHATSMLQTGYYTVSQVAKESGYDSLSYFSAAFRKQTGAAPSDFLNSSPFL